MANVFNPAGADRQDFTDLFANLDYLDLAYVAEAGDPRHRRVSCNADRKRQS